MNNPYIDPMKPQDLSGIAPMYQNTNAQQAMQAAALAQQAQLAQQAGQIGQGTSNPMALAMALRKDKKADPKKAAPIVDYSEEL